MYRTTPIGAEASGRPGALTLAALGALAGTVVSGMLVATPASANATTAASANATSATIPTATASSSTAAAVTPTRTYLWRDISVIRPGAAVRLTGKVVAGRVVAGTVARRVTGQLVTLQRRSGAVWRTITTVRLSRTGYASVVLHPTRPATLRLAFAGGTGLAASVSVPEVLMVKAYPPGRGARALAIAAAQTGKWYRFGAAGPRAFDCSGLILYSYRQVGVRLPHSANALRRYGWAVSRAAARPGDLVVFVRGGRGYHAGIYAGGGYMVDAPHAGARVGRHKIWSTNVVFRRLV